MYGDTSIIRALARAMGDQAADIRVEADRLVGRADVTEWTGASAEAMRRRTRDRAADLRRAAALHEDAAEALRRHAAEVDRLKELIAWVERRFRGLLVAARDRLAGFATGLAADLGLLPDPVDVDLDRFDPPPPGSRLWLRVDVPGLDLEA